MRGTLVWLVASLAFAHLTFLVDGFPLKVMTAPNLLRVGTAETIFVECQDCPDNTATMNVQIRVMNHPTKVTMLARTYVSLTKAGNFQGFAQITIPPSDFGKDPNVKEYVYLQALFPGMVLEKVVLLSFQSGYIFIQTDKPLYTPESTVFYRMFGVTPSMEPAKDNVSISIDIVTPEDIILPLDSYSLTSGIHSGIYKLGKYASNGLWKVVARFSSNPQQSFTAEFNVEEYVLPSFEVKLTAVVPYFYVDSETLTINIRARYLFDQDVEGTGYGLFGIIQNDERFSLTDSLKRVEIRRGVGKLTLKKEHFPKELNIKEMVGNFIYVKVSVATDNGGEIVEAELTNIQIVKSPYTINFRKTPTFFKPGMPLEVAVEVTHPDGSPAKGVAVVITPDNKDGRTTDNGIAKIALNPKETGAPITIEAKTNDPQFSSSRQSSATMTIFQHASESNDYIHIGVNTAEAVIRQSLNINFNFNNLEYVNHDITYLILSRGQLVTKGRFKRKGNINYGESIPITKEMLPSFRIIAYYHTAHNKVIADSIWVDAKDSCMGALKLQLVRPTASFEPGKQMELMITGNPGAKVGLVAVDKGVFVLNNKHRLSQKKVWDIVEAFDTGCTPGGGENSMMVFYDAGLLFKSDMSSETKYRKERKCGQTSRKKRAPTTVNFNTTLAKQYKGFERLCCLDGIKRVPIPYSCERRSKYIFADEACVKAFLHCCNAIEDLPPQAKEGNLILARSEVIDSEVEDIKSRTNFDESWLWKDFTLPDCPSEIPGCETVPYTVKDPLKDSITTWVILGISMSRIYGMCVSEPLEIIVQKKFFIDLRLPYSAVRGEQLEVKAILHNYSPDILTVRLDLLDKPNVCSTAWKRAIYRQRVTVEPLSSRTVPFVIIPMEVSNNVEIEVKAYVVDSHLSDGIMKRLRVVPEGLLTRITEPIQLNPANKGGTQVEIIKSRIPRSNVVPNSPNSREIFVTGSVSSVSSLLKNAIDGTSMGNLIYQPSGCGEQNLAHMTLPVIATLYLDQTKQWEVVGFERRNEAIEHIKTGYKNQLNFANTDGSFAIYENEKSSTWLTAYVIKVFAMANQLVGISTDVICNAVRFLVIHAQLPNGSFKEIGKVYSTAMTGDVSGDNSASSMTAFCLIAMQESKSICAPLVNGMTQSMTKALTFLEERLHSLTYSYAVAMVSYALANENKLNWPLLQKVSSTDSSHWPVRDSNVYTLEATAYALLSLVKNGQFDNAKPVVRWFNTQQRFGGEYGSTQATIMVYQALVQYWSNAREPEYSLNVDVLLPRKSNPVSYNFRRNNHHTTKALYQDKYGYENLRVKATGTGEGAVNVITQYYAMPDQNKTDCEKFSLTVQLIPDKLGVEKKIYWLKIEILYKDTTKDAGMSILDIGLLTGFTVNTHDLGLLSKGPARTISKYELNSPLSERGSIIIYLDQVSHTEREKIYFRIHQNTDVNVFQPAAVTVYEYYNRKDCVKFYHPEREGGRLMRHCRKRECICAEEKCSMQIKGQISNEKRIAKSCETNPESIIEFAYKVRVEQFIDGGSTDIYTMRILQVVKQGSSDLGVLNKNRTFLSFPQCRNAVDLQEDKTYLIMGTDKDFHKDATDQIQDYTLGANTWIEYWPSTKECQTQAEHRPSCLGMEGLIQRYDVFGCDMK